MNTIPYFSSILFFIVLFLSFNPITSINHLIQETCKKTSETDPNVSLNFCMSSLESDPGSHSIRLSLTKLGLISMNLTRKNVTETRVYIEHLLRKKTTEERSSSLDRYIKECLKDCLELYSDAITTIEEAIGDYKRKRYLDSNVKVSSVLDASSTCEDGFKEKKGVIVSPLKKRNNDTFQLSAISLSIIDMVRE